MTLANLPLQTTARVRKVTLDDGHKTWLSAVGLAEGDRVIVLRHAAFGGPLHVRVVETGGEIALDRALADAIETESV